MFQQIEFLVSMKLFSTWSYHSVKKLFLAMDQIELQNSKAVFYENDSPDFMYIIKSGEFKVLKSISFSKRPDTLQKEIMHLHYSSGAQGLSKLKNPLMLHKTFEALFIFLIIINSLYIKLIFFNRLLYYKKGNILERNFLMSC